MLARIYTALMSSAYSVHACKIGLGFSAGNTTGYGDASCTHFVGMASDGGDWADNGSNNFTDLVLRPTKQVGAAVTTGTNLTVAGNLSYNYNSYWAVDLIKGSPNFTIRAFVRTTSNSSSPPSEATFIGDMEDVTPAYNYHTYTAGQTIAVDEAGDGTLDSVCFHWGPSHPCKILMWGVTVWT